MPIVPQYISSGSNTFVLRQMIWCRTEPGIYIIIHAKNGGRLIARTLWIDTFGNRKTSSLSLTSCCLHSNEAQIAQVIHSRLDMKEEDFEAFPTINVTYINSDQRVEQISWCKDPSGRQVIIRPFGVFSQAGGIPEYKPRESTGKCEIL